MTPSLSKSSFACKPISNPRRKFTSALRLIVANFAKRHKSLALSDLLYSLRCTLDGSRESFGLSGQANLLLYIRRVYHKNPKNSIFLTSLREKILQHFWVLIIDSKYDSNSNIVIKQALFDFTCPKLSDLKLLKRSFYIKPNQMILLGLPNLNCSKNFNTNASIQTLTIVIQKIFFIILYPDDERFSITSANVDLEHNTARAISKKQIDYRLWVDYDWKALNDAIQGSTRISLKRDVPGERTSAILFAPSYK